MKYAAVSGLPYPVSRLVLGTMAMDLGNLDASFELLDAFVEIGGNCLDTAHIYKSGESEAMLGQWLKARGCRREIIVLGKGAHTPNCTVAGIDRQIPESLERMGIDQMDLWMMHRDNAEVPVGEFIDCLNSHVRSGHVRALGASNWTTQRIAEANQYAGEHALAGFVASSPNLSLAVWNEPIWSGCVTASDEQSLEWYRQEQMPLFSWSSQAQGFFTGRYSPNDRADEKMVRHWYSDLNFARLERARSLATTLAGGVTALQIALAYVLCQPFPTFALIGPRSLEELRSSSEALDVELTEEMKRSLVLSTDASQEISEIQ